MCTPDDVYSRPFVLTSTDAPPDAMPVVLHITADSLTYDAPTTVSGVPPSDAPSSGYTDDTDAHAVYVKNTELLNDHC